MFHKNGVKQCNTRQHQIKLQKGKQTTPFDGETTTDSGHDTDREVRVTPKRKKTLIKSRATSQPQSDNISGLDFPQTDEPTEDMATTNLEAPTTKLSEAHPTTPGVMITGSEVEVHYKETIAQMMKLGQEAIKEAQTKENELEKVQRKVSQLEKTLTKVRDEVARLTEELKEKDEKLKAFEKEMSKKEDEIAQHKQSEQEMRKKYEAAEAEREATKAEKEQVKESLKQVKSQLASLELEEQKTKDELKTLKSQMSELSAKYEAERDRNEKNIEVLRREFNQKIELKCTEQLREQLRKTENERDRERERVDMMLKKMPCLQDEDNN